MTYTINERFSDSTFTAAGAVAGVFGTPRHIESITIHHWGNLGQRHDDIVNFFVNQNDSTSAHFVVSDGRIDCLISPANASWAAGNAYGNATSIHIECHPEMTPGDFQTVAWLCNWLRQNYGVNLPIVPHKYWFNTACPGKWDVTAVDRAARALNTVTVKPASSVPAAIKPAPKPVAKPVAKPVTVPAGPVAPTGLSWVVQKGDSLNKIAAHYGITVAKLAAYNKIVATASLKIGLRLHIPGPLVWIVEAGNTLKGIADHYAMDVNALAAKNYIKNVNAISVGQVIKIL